MQYGYMYTPISTHMHMYIFIQVIILDISAKMMNIVEKGYKESAGINENVDLLLTIANNIRFIF